MSRFPMVSVLFMATLAGAAGGAVAQEAGETQPDGLRIFMDCRSRFCDFDFFRREIRFVNYVRDRRDAQVHVLVTTRRTGGGGNEFTISLIGRQELAGVSDTLVYFSSDTDTDDEIRTELTRTIRLGLVRYAAMAGATTGLDVVYEAPDTARTEAQVAHDPWNFWIFRVRVGGSLRGEELQSGFQGNMSLSANRTTEDWKIETGLNGFYQEEEFELSDSTKVRSIARDYGGWFFIARSIGEHWAAGALTEWGSSTFRNYDLNATVGPAIEYNIFPYSESSRRELTLTYSVVGRYFDYMQITIFDKRTEFRPSQSLEVSYSVRQPFGTISVSVEGSNFIDDWEKHRIDLRGWLDIRLVRGLQLNLNGSFSRIKDQIFLSREGATDEEVLLRRRELGTEFRYRLGLSLSYTFGSIFNNVVNPRFE